MNATKWLLSAAALFFAALTCGAFFKSDVALIENGTINAEIIPPYAAQKPETEAARTLAKFLAKIARGGNVNVALSPSGNPEKTKIFLKKNPDALTPSPQMEDLSRTNLYRFSFSGDEITIYYPRPEVATYAVGLFLRRHCGMEFFAPTELGLEYEKRENLKISAQDYTFKPSFDSVVIWDGWESRDKKLYFAMRGNNRVFVNFSHNLSNIFNRKVFEEHPEFFAERYNYNGILAPAFNAQPDFLNPEVPKFAAKDAIDFFREKPDEIMFSAGINDTTAYDQRPQTLAAKRGYFRGYPNYSDLYFPFANYVADAVAEEFPDKFIGCLAYLTTEDVPDSGVRRNVIPYTTTDRANYYDENFKAGDYALQKAWGESGAMFFGIYDYAYGAPFFVPRDITGYICDGIKRTHSYGARAYFAEAGALWAYDAPKIWVAMNLLENVGADADALEKEFHERFYKGCAPKISRFFEIAKEAWAGRHDGTRWLTLYKAESCADIFSEEQMAEMDNLLQEARFKAWEAKDPVLSKRVGELVLLFDVTRSMWAAWNLKKEIFRLVNDKAPAGQVADAVNKFADIDAKKKRALENFKRFSAYPNASLDFWNADLSAPLDLAAVYIMENTPELADGLKLDDETIGRAKLFAQKKPANILLAGNFEPAFPTDAPTLPIPQFWVRTDEDFDGTLMRLSREAAYTGEYGLEFVMSQISGISATLNIAPGGNMLMEGMIRADFNIGAICYASLVFLDENMNILGRKTLIIPNVFRDRFAKFQVSAKAPENASYASINFFSTYMKKGGKVYLDDLKVYFF